MYMCMYMAHYILCTCFTCNFVLHVHVHTYMYTVYLCLDCLPRILIPRSSSPHFTSMRVKFGETFYHMYRLIEMSSLTTQNLKEYLEYCCPYLENRLSKCESVSTVLKLVMEKCTLIDIGILENIVSHFNIKEGLRLVENYWKEIDQFCREISIELCLNERFSVTSPLAPLQCETATFIVDWDPSTYTLDDIRNLLSEAFKRLSKLVQVIVVTTGNSILITCTFPLSFTSSLLAEATDSLLILRNKWSLLKLIIGYTTILERIQEIKEACVCISVHALHVVAYIQ